MAITINNGVQNINGTPGAISGVFSERPSAIDIAPGTLYFSTDTAAIYQVVAGSWILYTGGGGGGTSTGINGLNGTTDIGLGGTLINDTNINGSGNSYSLTFDNVKSFVVNSDLFNVNSVSNPNVFFNISTTFTELKCLAGGFNIANNVTFIGDWDGYNNGTKIAIDADTQHILTLFGGSAFGLYITTDDTFVGDYGGVYKATQLIVQQSQYIIKTSLFNETGINYTRYGFYIDYNAGNPYTVIGDYGNDNSGTRMYITEDKTITTALGVIQKGVICQFNIDKYSLGDFNSDTNGLTFVVNNNQFEIYTGKTENTGEQPLVFGYYMQQDNINFRRSGIGDVLDVFNATSIIVDDLNRNINFTGNITSATPSVPSGQYLILYVNGSPYKIQLLNP